MISTNPFAILAESVPSIGMQIFALAMVALAGGGTILDIIHLFKDERSKQSLYILQNKKRRASI